MSPLRAPVDASGDAVGTAPGALASEATPVSDGRPSFWHRAPSWFFLAVTAVGAFALVWSASYPTGSLAIFIAGMYWLVPCVIIWLVRLVTYLVGASKGARTGSFWPFLLAPILGVATIALTSSSLPFDARWGASQSRFDQAADEMAAAHREGMGLEASLVEGRRIGLYSVDSSWVDEDGNAFFHVSGSGFISSAGFVRAPGGPPEPEGEDDFEHLEGDWYIWYDGF